MNKLRMYIQTRAYKLYGESLDDDDEDTILDEYLTLKGNDRYKAALFLCKALFQEIQIPNRMKILIALRSRNMERNIYTIRQIPKYRKRFSTMFRRMEEIAIFYP
eukprot:GAHX01000377.1.p1 GENE.GAHX01000377.1~~GAHX01000377.1.p1  ORF type:complete len:105 (-),score=6.26 GAHX01000377.1:75-389(-)